MAADVGVTSGTWRHRERNVMATSAGSTDGAHSRKTVSGGGSSTTFSRAFAAPSVSRSASSMTTICQCPMLGRRDAVDTTARISSTPIDSPSGTMRRTSAWVPAMVVVQARHCPQPGTPVEVHCRAAAKLSAATERPEPGGPVNNQAWVIAPPELEPGVRPARNSRAAVAAATSSASTASCPSRRANTSDIASRHYCGSATV